MSMIYECPTCHAPQGAGRTSCLSCGAEFDGAVPDDALVPEPTESAAPEPTIAETQVTEAQGEPTVVETVAAPVESAPEPPRLEYVSPPPEPTAPPYSPPAYQPPPNYAAPQNYSANAPSQRPGIAVPKALLIALPVVLVLVLGVVFFTQSLNSDATPPAAPPPASVTAPVAPAPAPAPASPPVSLSGGGASSQSGSSTAKWLVGRWQAKSSDYYVFNDNGTGSRGSTTGKLTSDSFVWVMAQNQIALYLADKQVKMALSPGTDDNTLFLRGEDGKYVEYVRTKTNA